MAPKALRKHVRSRARERYGVNASRAVVAAIVRLIQQGQGEYLAKKSNTRTVWEVVHNEQRFRVVYNKDTKTIQTFLPLDGYY